MAPGMIFNIGVVVCGIAVAGAIIAIVVLRHLKKRLNRQLDAEFGKGRFDKNGK